MSWSDVIPVASGLLSWLQQHLPTTLSDWAVWVGWISIPVSIINYYRQRKRYPRANFSHRIEVFPIDDKKILVHITLVIENKGDALLSIDDGCIRLYRLKPWPQTELLDRIVQDMDPINPGEVEVDWPLICKRLLPLPQGQIDVEGGETEEIPFTN